MVVSDGAHGQCSVPVIVEQDSHALATDIHFAAPTAMAHSRFYVDRRLTRNTKVRRSELGRGSVPIALGPPTRPAEQGVRAI
jgi:hypothetical protein